MYSPHPSRRRAKAAALVAASALTVSTLGVAPASAADPAPSAAAWLAGELSNGLMVSGEFADYGLSADTALALTAVGGQGAVVGAISNTVAAQVTDYISGDAAGDPGSTYSGATAKAMVLAQSAGANPRSFGGVDLVSRLEDQVASTAPISGRIADTSSYGDFANTIGQAFAVRGLTTAGSGRANGVTSFLLAQQCSPGYFRLSFNADKSDPRQGCVEGGGPGSVPDTDTTALVVLQLAAIRNPQPRVSEAITRATDWLSSRQQSDGSLVADAADEVVNSNSTGLASWALGSQGRCVAAGRAANWLRDLQVPAGTTGALAADLGAVAYDRAAYTAGQGAGVTSATADQWRRATAQAAPALAYTLSPTLVEAKAPKKFLKSETTQWVSLKGVAAGDSICVTAPDGTVSTLEATGADFNASFELPDETGKATYTFTYAGGQKKATFKVLDKVTIKAKPIRSKVRVGKKAKIRLKGLERGEKIKVRVGKKVVDKGVANKAGVYVSTFTVTKRLTQGRKRLFVKATGQFAQLRKGRTTLRVLR